MIQTQDISIINTKALNFMIRQTYQEPSGKKSYPLGRVKALQLGLYWLVATPIVIAILWKYTNSGTQVRTALFVLFILASVISFIKTQSVKTVLFFAAWSVAVYYSLTVNFKSIETRILCMVFISVLCAGLPGMLYYNCRQVRNYFDQKYPQLINVTVIQGNKSCIGITEHSTGSPLFYLIVSFFCALPAALFGGVLYFMTTEQPVAANFGSKLLLLLLTLLSCYGVLKYLKKALIWF